MKSSKDTIRDYLSGVRGCMSRIEGQMDKLLNIVNVLKNANHIYICGNGGSSATASHMKNDLQKIGKLKAFCLTDSTPLITALANDKSYGDIFSMQLLDLYEEGDVLFVMTGSGNSLNILNAVGVAKSLGMKTIILIGEGGGVLTGRSDLDDSLILHVPTDMLHAEDSFMVINHIIATLLMDKRKKKYE